MSSDNPNGFKTILVTGGAGYVGSALVPELLQQVRRCVVYAAIFRANRAIGERLREWVADHQSVAHLLAKGTAPGIAPEAFVNLTMRNLLGCLRDTDTMWRKLAENHDSATDDDALGEALSAATRVFETTTAGFKS